MFSATRGVGGRVPCFGVNVQRARAANPNGNLGLAPSPQCEPRSLEARRTHSTAMPVSFSGIQQFLSVGFLRVVCLGSLRYPPYETSTSQGHQQRPQRQALFHVMTQPPMRIGGYPQANVYQIPGRGKVPSPGDLQKRERAPEGDRRPFVVPLRGTPFAYSRNRTMASTCPSSWLSPGISGLRGLASGVSQLSPRSFSMRVASVVGIRKDRWRPSTWVSRAANPIFRQSHGHRGRRRGAAESPRCALPLLRSKSFPAARSRSPDHGKGGPTTLNSPPAPPEDPAPPLLSQQNGASDAQRGANGGKSVGTVVPRLGRKGGAREPFSQ